MANNKDFKVKNGIQPTVYQESLGTVVSGIAGYGISGAAYDSKSFSVAGQETSPLGVNLSLDGTKMFVMGFAGDDINLYNLGTAFDVSTAVPTVVALPVGSQDNTPWAFDFKPDGTSIYMVGSQNNTVFQYNLTSAFDIGTASYANKSFSVLTQASSARGLTFKPDGTKMYVLDNGADDIYQYSLSTAWDVSTANYDSVSFSVTSQATSPYGITFNADGTELFLAGHNTNAVYKYALTTAYDISTASYSSIYFDLSSQTTTPTDVFFADSGQKMYINSYGDDTIYQYSTVLTTAQLDLSTGSVFDYTPTSDVQVTLSNPAASGTSSGATLLLSSEDATGVSSAFSTTLYTGTNSTQTITNGIDLAGDGGMLWFKNRTLAEDPMIVDTVRGGTADLYPNGTNAVDVDGSISSFNSDGFTFINTSGARQNVSGYDYVSWAFKEQAKFFDIVTWTGNGTHPRTFNHSLNCSIGFMATKETNASGNWTSFHRGLANGFGTGRVYLNTTNSVQNESLEFLTSNNSSFTLTSDTGLNSNGVNYVAYVFAHDTDASSIIKCGSFTTDGGGGATVELGWEPQFVMIKNIENDNASLDNWDIMDTERGLVNAINASYNRLRANTNDVEAASGTGRLLTPTGFQTVEYRNSSTYIYMAIRKVPPASTITYDPTLEWSGGTAPTAPALGETDVVTFNTRDGGSTYQGVLAIDGAK